MTRDYSKLHTESADFFNLSGSVWMKLGRSAAIDVCLMAAERGYIIARVEGGIWHNLNFEMRLDSIWDGLDPPVDKKVAHKNNLRAAHNIETEQADCNAFILTAPTITGWKHKMK
ncbi:MAG: colicin immunity protein [Hyphomicrobiales bacterium]|nr:colicin immunity protein [Hyphomicrobiales bacterium]